MSEKFTKPLAERLKPLNFSEFIGQTHLIGEKGILTPLLLKKKLFSFILWGPPGTGKTALAYLVGKTLNANFVSVSAVDTTIKDLKGVILQAKKLKTLGKLTILFIDEIHRFNKSQQSFLLPFVEKGDIYLIGATTENPSFEIIPPLLSRIKVFILNPLSKEEIFIILTKALKDKERGLGNLDIKVKDEVLEKIAETSSGDARVALNTLEWLVELSLAQNKKEITLNDISEALFFKPLYYDKSQEEHYNLISAFHKSMRGSDPDATIYWLARMLSAGEDPLYIARRIIACAAEDVGLADPMALIIAVAAKNAFEALGQPEGELALAEAALYVACAPKSNSVYKALNLAYEEIEKSKNIPVPLHLRNPVTKLMKKLGYGKNYKYTHNFENGFIEQEYLPQEIKTKIFYKPKNIGFETKIKAHLKSLW
ncbi:MAG: replication-associated recombination protein A, partial [Thermodesulfobacteriota bacterium]